MNGAGNLTQSQHMIQTTRHTLYGCYALRSLNKDYPKAVYIGFTNNPLRRARQHNGEIKNGAKKTKKARPWEMCIVVHGFPSHHSALQFEWAWQNPKQSKVLKSYMSGVKVKQGFAGILIILHLLLNSRTFRVFPLSILCTSMEVYQQVLDQVHPPPHMQVVQDDVYNLPCYDGHNSIHIDSHLDEESNEESHEEEEAIQNVEEIMSSEEEEKIRTMPNTPLLVDLISSQVIRPTNVTIDTPLVQNTLVQDGLCDVCLHNTDELPVIPTLQSTIPSIFQNPAPPVYGSFPLDFLQEDKHAKSIKQVFCYYCGVQYHTLCALHLSRNAQQNTNITEKDKQVLDSFVTPKKNTSNKKDKSKPIPIVEPDHLSVHTHCIPQNNEVKPQLAFEKGPIPLSLHCSACNKLLLWAKLLQVAVNAKNKVVSEESSLSKKKQRKREPNSKDLAFIDTLVEQMQTQEEHMDTFPQSQPVETSILKRKYSYNREHHQTPPLASQTDPPETPPLTQRLGATKFMSMRLDK